ncbi:MAG: hypothetical protein CSA95_04640 [Bacteroidetes bacterium]|nr:MAG: hypothetical protein CSA95_04640 [Bacteroidota bacterium]
MKLKNILYTLLFVGLFSSNALAQKGGYSIHISIDGISDTLAYLAFYMGDKIYVKDTAIVEKGALTFENDSDTLKGGVYILAGQASNKYFDFLINENTHFSLKTSIDNLVEEMEVENSPENALFYSYIARLNKAQEERITFDKLLERENTPKDSIAYAHKQLSLINERVDSIRNTMIETHKGTFFSSLIRSTIPAEIPPLPLLPDGSPDSSQLWYLYKSSFWDHYDLSDDKILRTPEFTKKVDNYFDNVVFQHPDSLSVAIDAFIAKTEGTEDLYKYLIWDLTFKYERPKIMGLDEVYVHMAKRYYESGIDTWNNPTVVKNIIDKAHKIEPLLLGKKAPNLILMDTLNNLVQLYQVKARYTLVFFWEPDCGHCKKEVPHTKKLYTDFKDKYDFQIYAVCCDTSFRKMKRYITKNQLNWINVNGYYSASGDFHDLYDVYSTPVMYLLDEEKKIVAKHLLSEDIQLLIEDLEKRKE